MSMWSFGKLLLDKYYLISKREATSMISIYAVAVVENNDICPLIMMSSYSLKSFEVKTFANYPKTVKFLKVFTCKIFPI